MSAFYVAIWTLQVFIVLAFYLTAQRRIRYIRQLSEDLSESQSLMLKAMVVLRNCDNSFDSRYMADQLRDHLARQSVKYRMTEGEFRKLARKAQLHDVDTDGNPRS